MFVCMLYSGPLEWLTLGREKEVLNKATTRLTSRFTEVYTNEHIHTHTPPSQISEHISITLFGSVIFQRIWVLNRGFDGRYNAKKKI